MRDFAVSRNTVRDYNYIGMCELKIIDIEKYHSVVQQERGRKGKAPIKKNRITLPGSLRWVQGPVKQAERRRETASLLSK